MMKNAIWGMIAMSFIQCRPEEISSEAILKDLVYAEGLIGQSEYLDSPYVTAGDRLYMVGHQDGTFPDLGWHLSGEMGGIWDHPIKLMDGFVATITLSDQTTCLLKADTFVNYPFANKHTYGLMPNGLLLERFQFVPDNREAVVVEYSFSNTTDTDQSIYFTWMGYSDLRPVWLGEQTGMKDSRDIATWQEDLQAWSVKDSLNEWYVIFGSSYPLANYYERPYDCAYRPGGQGTVRTLTFEVDIPAEGTVNLPITIAGSYRSLPEAKETYHEVALQALQLLMEKQERYRSLAAQAQLNVPDENLQQAFKWLKYNTDWLVREVPEIGCGLSAGLPDYPWWFGVDSEYALKGALAIGRFDLVFETIELLHRLSEQVNGNGRIIHEASTNGAVFNRGNINETPQFTSLIWSVYEWTGDRAFLEKYFPTIQKGLEWLLAANDADGNLLPDGYGMMEIHGMDSEMIDVAAYTQKAFADAAKIAEAIGEPELAIAYRATAQQLYRKINTDFWVPEYNSYADFIGTPEEALRLVEDAIVRADTLGKPWAVEELLAAKATISAFPPGQKRGFVLHHNWVVNTPMEMGTADTAKALVALETGSRFVNPYGVFVTGIDRDESDENNEGSFAAGKKVFSYTGAVMTLPTGVQAVAENNYGRPDRALDYLRRMTRTFGYALPGSIYEVSPDFGMMTQAWNLYSYAVPIVQQFFGVRPLAALRMIRIQPQMPESWNRAGLENVLVAENSVDIQYNRQEGSLVLDITQTEPDWTLEIAFPAGQFNSWESNGQIVSPVVEGGFHILRTTEQQIVLKLY